MSTTEFPLRRARFVVRAGAFAVVAVLALATFVGGGGALAALVFVVAAGLAAWLARPLLDDGPALSIDGGRLRAPFASVDVDLRDVTSARLESRGDLKSTGAMVLVLESEGETVARVPTGALLTEPQHVLTAVRAHLGRGCVE